jgi:Cytochrome c554 and c-prime
MAGLFPNSRHLLRMVGLFGLGLLLFVAARALWIPKGFGELGHFRTGAIEANRLRPASFAGKKVCIECHTDVPDKQKGGKHAAINCEACHGALAAHATSADPSKPKPALPDPAKLCLTCHQANVAKPKGFKQVDPKEHNAGAKCTDCHAAHNPMAGLTPTKEAAK